MSETTNLDGPFGLLKLADVLEHDYNWLIAARALRDADAELDRLRARVAALEAAARERTLTGGRARPPIVCLCGSTRFYAAFQEANYRETMAGRIVLSVGFYPHSQDEAHGGDVGVAAEQKATLDELHKRKIDLADDVLVLNVGGYIGDSTRSEIEYAEAQGKPVRYFEPASEQPTTDDRSEVGG